MKKPSKPNPHWHLIQTRFAVTAPVASPEELRRNRLRLQQEAQTLSDEFDRLADQLLNEFGCTNSATTSAAPAAPLPGASS